MKRKKLTPKGRVLRRCRHAHCLWAPTLYKYVVTFDGLIVRGEGRTAREAWADADRRL